MSAQPTSPGTERVLADIRAERARQSEIGYDREHDRRHNVHFLVDLAGRYAHKPSKNPAVEVGYYDRERLVQAAALLVAATERLDDIEAGERP